MSPSQPNQNFAAYIDDRPEDGVFRLNRGIYTDDAVFAAEMENIYERGWIYICHESQLAEKGAYFSAYIGRQPVFLVRDGNGAINGFINACSHRGAVLTPLKQGKASSFTCRFHGWVYGVDGRCLKVKNEKEGYPEPEFDRSCYNLTPVPRVDHYRGFVFASLSADVPPLAEHLGPAAAFIDLMADQSPDGVEIIKGSSTYMVDANWKTQSENSVDGYHVSTVHRIFATTIAYREQQKAVEGLSRTEDARITGRVDTGVYHLGNGHMLAWATRTKPEVAPLYAQIDRLKAEFSPERIDWMLGRGRNLAVFPNMMLMDNPSTQVRVIRPIAANRTEITVYCVAPKNEPVEARRARLAKFGDFYLTTGMSTSDDASALEDAQAGAAARYQPWSDFTRGIGGAARGADKLAGDLGIVPDISCQDWEDESHIHGFYRHWIRLMEAGAAPRAAAE